MTRLRRPASFVIGMPETFYLANKEKVRDILLEVWGLSDTPENREWVDSGWQDYIRTANKDITIKIYHVSRLQIKESCTDANLARWKTILQNNPNVKAARTTNFEDLILSYGLEPKYTQDEYPE